tara:strand:+ start:55 stop:753 length:699 start_codon:yes stop_codon:yes gene_type:complete
MAKTIEIEAEQENKVDEKLLSLIENNIVEIRNSENSNTTIKLIDYVSKNVFPTFKNKDKEKEIRDVRKYLLAVYPFDDSIGVSRGAYDMMNQRVSKGGQLVFKKKITINQDKLLDKKGDRIVISKIDDLHNKFIEKKQPKAIEVVDEPISMPQNDEEYLSDSIENFDEVTESYQRADVIIQSFQVLLNLNDSDLSDILNEHDLQTFVKDNHKPLKHIFDRVLESGKQQSKVA